RRPAGKRPGTTLRPAVAVADQFSFACRYSSRRLLLRLNVAARKREEGRPVRAGRMTATVLAKGQVAVNQRRLDGRKLAGPHVLAAQKPVNRPGAHCR